MEPTMPNEVINAQASTESQDSTASTNTSEQTSLDPRLEALRQEVEAEPDYSIPEKFRGKSLQDVSRSYSELEKLNGKVAGEKAHAEKALEEAKARAAQLEQERQALYAQLQARSSVPQQQQQEADPYSSFDENFQKDPVEAMKGLGKGLIGEVEKTRQQLRQEMQAKSASEHYQRQKKENPDFAALDQDMQQLAHQYGSFLRPEVANSPEVIELLYSLAKSKNMSRYIDEAVKKHQSASDMVKAEKRAAYSETSTSTGGQGRVNPEDLSSEELGRLLGRSK